MIKKLLNNFLRSFTFDHDREKIEKYLSQSANTYDLEQRMRELEQKGIYNQFYIYMDLTDVSWWSDESEEGKRICV